MMFLRIQRIDTPVLSAYETVRIARLTVSLRERPVSHDGAEWTAAATSSAKVTKTQKLFTTTNTTR